MTGISLLCFSLTAGVLVIVALVTPGWFGLEFQNNGKEVKVAMSIFYTEVCFGPVCDTMDNAKVSQKHEHVTSGFSKSLWFSRFMVEAALSIIGVGIGTSLTAVYATSIINRERGNSPVFSRSRAQPTAGLIFNTIGVICGGILCLELIIANVRVDNLMSALDTLSELNMKKIFPYSIVIMAIGLVLEIITIILTGLSSRSEARGEGGIVLTPAVSPTSIVVQHTSSVPYQQFA